MKQLKNTFALLMAFAVSPFLLRGTAVEGVNAVRMASSIGNYVWEDANGNGLQEMGEPGKSLVKIDLLSDTDGDGQIDDVIASTASDAAGFYQFTGLPAGTYVLQFVAPTGFKFTAAAAGGNADTDSDVNPGTGRSPVVVLAADVNNATVDAGLYHPCSIGSFVWADEDKNGLQNSGEPGLPGVTVVVSGTDGAGVPVSWITTTDANGEYLNNNLAPGAYRVSFVAPPGALFTLQNVGPNDAVDSDPDPLTGQCLVEILTSGERNLNYDCGFTGTTPAVYGSIKNDENSDCTAALSEQGLGGWLVTATDGNNVFRSLSKPDGQYKLYALPGTYSISATPPAYAKGIACALPQALTFPNSNLLDIAVGNVDTFPVMTVDLGTIRLRRCFDSYYQVRYCNAGPVPAENAYVMVKLDSFLSFQTASVPFLDMGNQWYRFDVGTVQPFDCRLFSIKVKVSCDAVLGQTHCSEARIFPDSDTATEPWTGAKVEAFARCLGNTLQFTLKNTGNSVMSADLEYVVIEDGVMGKPAKGNALPPGDSVVINLPANGSTWRVEAKQEPTYTGWSVPVLSVEGCTNNATFSTGFIQQFTQNEASPSVDIDCTANTGAYDPNDKQGLPLGYGPLRYIEPRTELEYTIRFQNTGTDTAFTVRIIDTLSGLFDVRTLRVGASSHPYEFELIGPGILHFRFPDIRLPHKGIDEAGSQGFVRYSVAPREQVALETDLHNRAGIYFDFNLPIVTNTTQHRIGVNFVPVSVWQPLGAAYRTVVQPNPFSNHATVVVEKAPVAAQYQLRVFSAAGLLVLEQRSATSVFSLHTETLNEGLYFFQVYGDGRVLSVGKMVVGRE